MTLMDILPLALISAGILFVAVVAMAIGALSGRKPISGSCGGIANKGCPCGKSAGERCGDEPSPSLPVMNK